MTLKDLLSEVNATVANNGLSRVVIAAGASEGFSRDRNDVFFRASPRYELWLDAVFPLALHDLVDASFAQTVPSSPEP